MGLESRDYARDGSYTRSLAGWGVDFTPVVKYLIIANVIVYLLQVLITDKSSPERPTHYLEPILEQYRAAEDKARAAAEAAEAAGDTKAAEGERRKEKLARDAREGMEVSIALAVPETQRHSSLTDWLALEPKKTVLSGQAWRLLTSTFCHDRTDVLHILFNMLGLYWFGTRLERMYGSREFLLFYLAAGLCASLAFVGLAFWTDKFTPAIGASGAVLGVMTLYTIFYPWETIRVFWFLPVPLWALLGLYVIYDLHPTLRSLSGERVWDNVAHSAHLGGVAFGAMYWKLGMRLEELFGRWRWRGTWKAPRARAQVRAYREPVVVPFRDDERSALSAQVDAVLEKISREGKESLTDLERDILIRASKKYRGEK